MEEDNRRERLRTFLLGGLVGASAVLATVRRKRPPRRRTPAGLAAFEEAPCYEETLESDLPISSTLRASSR
jgi:hypothetical protein